ncbi:hypothetical protein [Pedobacter sp. KACC 23697]|uniref:Uncharacterized protein n=1 Tax=Pedobacter sp. KACC 23697 TaxID=3149230 RepID=A0AAU7K3Z6_9SPHI
MRIYVSKDYNLLVGSSLKKIAERINVEAKSNNLSLVSNKKVVGEGGKSS